MEFPNPAGGWRPAVEVRNAERFGPVPTTSIAKNIKLGKAWITEFERQAEAA